MTKFSNSLTESKLKIRQERSKLHGTHLIALTPDLAKSWLLNANVKNRPLNETTAKEYARRMEQGFWMVNGETIKFSKEGNMIDGQHRCRAVEIYGKNVEVEVRFGLDASVFDTLDEGKRRQARDVLAVDSVPNYTIVAAAINMVVSSLNGSKRMSQSYNRPTNRETREWLLRNRDIEEDVLFGLKLYSVSMQLISPSKFAAYRYLFKQKSQQDADKFLMALASGAGLAQDSPILHLRTKLLQSKYDKQRKLNARIEHALIIKAWNFYRIGKSVKIFKFDSERENFPEIK